MSQRNVCNNFKKAGFCRFGDRCKFSHIIDKPDIIQELFSRLDVSSKPSSSVRVGLDAAKQRELREFLKLSKSDVRKDIEEFIFEDDSTPAEDLEETANRELERQLDEKYKHIPDSVFKRNFMQNIIGNQRANKGMPSIVTCSLERDPKLDYNLKTQLCDKLEKNEKYKKMLRFRKKLPVFQSHDEILQMIKENQVIVISGETGSGKTTQIAQFILDLYIMSNCGSTCHVVCTQPRRISAVSVAQRVADERGEKCGESVGYQIRLDKQLPRKQGSILFCTTGILLQRLQSDPGLCEVTHVIIDEIHERNMDTDFVMTVIREVLPQRTDLRIIVMSATLNAEKFSAYFDNCPSINIPGCLFPVTELFLEDILSVTGYVKTKSRRKPPRTAGFNEFSDIIVPFVMGLRGRYSDLVIDQLLAPESEYTDMELIQRLIEHICEEKDEGAILVFLSGWDSISSLVRKISSSEFFSVIGAPVPSNEADDEEEEVENDEEAEKREIKILEGIGGRKFLVLPLHSKMPTVNQAQVFDPPPPGVRKIIVSTNIAETSITINDVVYIIDSGKMKVKSYDIEKNISTLQDEWVSKANAQQRLGRAGRVQAGECYRLYTRARKRMLLPEPRPEILRTRLEELILKIKLLQLGKVSTILNRIMDSPDPKTVNSSLKLLETLRALDNEENLTPLGYHLANLPLEPHIAKMIFLGAIFSCVDPILSVAACLSFKDPFVMPMGHDQEVIKMKISISQGNKSDHLVLAEGMRLWESCVTVKQGRKFCRQHFLSLSTLRNLRELKIEFAQYLYDMGYLYSKNTKDESANRNSTNFSVLKAVICAGLYPNIAIVQKVQRYLNTGKTEVVVSTPEDGDVKLHRSSINDNQVAFESPYLMYHEKLKSSYIFLHDTTMVSSLPLILFSHKVQYNATQKIIHVNNNILFHCDKDLATLVLELRQEVQKVLDAYILEPGTVDWNGNDAKTRVLKQAIDLVTSEDTPIKNTEKAEASKKRNK